MARFNRTRKNAGFKKYMVTPIVIGYLLFCTTALLVSPTTATFTDSQTIKGELSTSTQFSEEEKSDKAVDVPRETTNGDNNKNTENVSDVVEQDQDKKSPVQADDVKPNETVEKAESLQAPEESDQSGKPSKDKSKVETDSNKEVGNNNELAERNNENKTAEW